MDALNVSISVQNLIKQKLNQEIAEKQLAKKKLTPFLFHKVVGEKFSTNIHSMAKDAPKNTSKSLHDKQIETEPRGLSKDNLGPKNVSIESVSPSQSKQTTTRLRRFTFSSKKQSFKNMNTFQQFRTINTDLQHSKDQPHLSNIKYNQTIQLSSSPKLIRKVSKTKKQPIKLNLKKSFIHQTEDEIENKLRAKKAQEEQERIENMELETFKSQRFEKLKRKFLIHKNQNQTISFDFDGSVINLEDEEDKSLTILQEKQRNFPVKLSARQSLSRTFQTIESSLQPNSKKKDDSFYPKHENQQKVGMPFQAIYRVKNKDLNSVSNQEETRIEEKYQIKQKHSAKNNRSSLQQSQNISELSLNSKVKKTQSKLGKLSAQPSNMMSLESSQHFDNKKIHSSVKVFYDSSLVQKSARKQKQARILHKKNVQEYTNNFQRQTSTITYLQISEGIRYLEEITIHDEENINFSTKKVRYATIQKSRNLSQKSDSNHNNSLKSNLTFRSYLPLNQNQLERSLTALNKTIQAFSESGKSFGFCLHKDQKQSDELKNINSTAQDKDEFAIFDNPKPIFIKDNSGQKKNTHTCRPRTTQTGIRLHQNWQQISRPFFDQKPNKNTNILDMKQKMLLKQKQRVMSSHTARIIK